MQLLVYGHQTHEFQLQAILVDFVAITTNYILILIYCRTSSDPQGSSYGLMVDNERLIQHFEREERDHYYYYRHK